MRNSSLPVLPLFLFISILLGACTNTIIDEYRPNTLVLDKTHSVVVLGRRHRGDHETEPEFVSCIAEELSEGRNAVNVIAEQEFVDRLYPWFEPRTAPMRPQRFRTLLENPMIGEAFESMDLQYIVWVDGFTEKVDSAGSISCAIGPGGGGCVGFGTWEDNSEYKISVWDIATLSSVAEISAAASGTSYMPALIIPIPLLARVKSDVCDSVGAQLKGMFSDPMASQKNQ